MCQALLSPSRVPHFRFKYRHTSESPNSVVTGSPLTPALSHGGEREKEDAIARRPLRGRIEAL